MTDKEKKELYYEISCALTHDVNTCDHCKKCEGANSGEIRLNMVEKIANLFGEKPFWDNEGE